MWYPGSMPLKVAGERQEQIQLGWESRGGSLCISLVCLLVGLHGVLPTFLSSLSYSSPARPGTAPQDPEGTEGENGVFLGMLQAAAGPGHGRPSRSSRNVPEHAGTSMH